MFEVKLTFDRPTTNEGADVIHVEVKNKNQPDDYPKQVEILMTNAIKRLSAPKAKLFLEELERHINCGINDFYLESMPQE